MVHVMGLLTKYFSGVILGLGWLRQQQAFWNFDRGTVELGGKFHRLQARATAGWCRRVNVDEVSLLSECELQAIVCNNHSLGRTEPGDVCATSRTRMHVRVAAVAYCHGLLSADWAACCVVRSLVSGVSYCCNKCLE